ncbi:hypothetical protein, partial [uncultured Ruminococcus sp.]|uniref:hypothetical protein n=1 Tax=uncultured Ruminococcus sp. TaxID=165186 RepID=UPI002674E771
MGGFLADLLQSRQTDFMYIFNFFQTFFSSIHFEKLELYNQSIKATPHKDCATDASSNFSSDET